MVEVARILFRFAPGGGRYRSRVAHGDGVLQPSHAAGAVSRLLVHGGLVAGEDSGDSAEAEWRELHGDERDFPGRKSVECDRPRRRAGWLVVFLHGWPRHERRHLSCDLAWAGAKGCDGHRHRADGSDPAAAARQQLGAAEHCGAAEADWRCVGSEPDWCGPHVGESAELSTTGAGHDAALWTGADDGAAAYAFERAERIGARAGG